MSPERPRLGLAGGAAALSGAVLVVTFIGLLGGTHPSDAGRDRVLLVAALAFAALNVPTVVWMARHGVRIWVLVMLLVRCAAAIWVLWFVHSISHEGAWRGGLAPARVEQRG
jgi:hypothetical protein